MPIYTCERCLKEFSQKSHYTKHQNKKIHCQNNKKKIEEVVENIIINKKLISNNTENKIINTMDTKLPKHPQQKLNKISNNVSLYINDANDIADKLNNIDFIYMDPPYDTNRDFALNSKSDNTGFSDKWGSNGYESWLSTLVSNLKKTLSNKGTLVIHISSENSFVIEKILRDNFINIEKIYWKRCHGKNTVKNKFGAVIDI